MMNLRPSRSLGENCHYLAATGALAVAMGWVLLAAAPYGVAQTSLSTASAGAFLEPYQSIEISAIRNGIIKSIHVRQGEFVKAGQPLVSLDADVLQAEYEVAKARAECQGFVQARRAEHAQQLHRYQMLAALKSRGHSGDAELNKERALLQAAEGNLRAAQEDQKIAVLDALRIRSELKELTLRTPIDGYVVAINGDVAEPVGPASRRDDADCLIRVVDVSRLKATAFLPHKEAKRLKVGDCLIIASADSEDDWQAQGKIEFISPLVYAATGLVEVQLAIDNPDFVYQSGVPALVLLN